MSESTRKQTGLENLKGTKTEQNLHTALSGESQAYLRYKWFEKRAKDEGYVEISQIFCETAANEKEHAEIWFKFLGGYSSTKDNLSTAAGGEHFEWATMYSQFAEEAKEEGFDIIASLFERVASIEKNHEDRYRKYYDKLESGSMFKASSSVKWICLNCGYVVEGQEPPAVCPTCAYPKGYFKMCNGN